MIVHVILLALVIFAVFNGLNRFRTLPAEEKPKHLRRFALYAIIGLVVFMAATGRLHWVGAAVAVAVPFITKLFALGLRFLPVLRWWQQQSKPSVFTTPHIRLIIDTKTGHITGELLSGDFTQQPLEALTEEQLQTQLQQWQQTEPESARLLYAYMQRRFTQNSHQSHDKETANINTREEALNILGLEEGADKKAIIAAHKSLIQKLHPDRGGSHYLAAKVNQAKDFLLK